LREVLALSRLHHAFVVRYFTAWVETSEETDNVETDETSYPIEDAASDDGFSSDGDWMTSSGGRRISDSLSDIVFEMSGAGGDLVREPDDDISAISIPARKHSPHIELPRVLFIQMEYCDQKTLR
jgi:translation initiation factor 2-alpha kinase 4